jgi:hypothetical protein
MAPAARATEEAEALQSVQGRAQEEKGLERVER